METAGLGPGPFGAMLLADMGAEVIRLERLSRLGCPPHDLMLRGRHSLAIDLKHPRAAEAVLRLVERANVFIDCFRPGVVERLGIGPEPCQARNPGLVYARMTGWGQEGPLAQAAGHDINYIALAGALGLIGRLGAPPTPPLNLVGDFGGGGMLLAFGIVCGLLNAATSGRGQVMDVAIVDGVAALLAEHVGPGPSEGWHSRGTNLLDSGAPFYDVYETSDGRYVSVGAIESDFYAELVNRLGIGTDEFGDQMDRASWPAMRKRFAEVFRSRTRREWCDLLEGGDSCFAPVLDLDEVADHPQHASRGTFRRVEGVLQPAVTPRFTRTPGVIGKPPSCAGADTVAALLDWGFDRGEVDDLMTQGVVGQA